MSDWVDIVVLVLQGFFLLICGLGDFIHFPPLARSQNKGLIVIGISSVCLGFGMLLASFSIAQYQLMIVCLGLISVAFSMKLFSFFQLSLLFPIIWLALGVAISVTCFSYGSPYKWLSLSVFPITSYLFFSKKLSFSLQKYCKTGAFLIALLWLAEPVYAHAFSHKKPIQTVQWDFFTSLPTISTILALLLIVITGFFIPRKHKF